MSTTAVAQAPPADRWLRILLLVASAVNALGALYEIPAIFVAFTNDYATTLLLVAQIMLSVSLAIAPFIAIPAFLFARKGRLREATLALAALLLLPWLLDETTSFILHGAEFDGSFFGVILFAHHFIFPALGLASGWLAYTNRQPLLAGVLVCLPSLFTWVTFVMFAIPIFIYGF
jgi:hypothetical protein